MTRPRSAGFTMVELVVVMVIVGVLAAIGIPRLVGDKTIEAATFGDTVVSGLRRAQKLANGHLRVVCAALSANGVSLKLTLDTATPCAATLTGVAATEYTGSDSAIAAVPGGLPATLYFQPDGRITNGAASTTTVSGTIAIRANGKTMRTIAIDGSSGYVE